MMFRRRKCDKSANWQSSMQIVSGNTCVVPSPKVREECELAKFYAQRQCEHWPVRGISMKARIYSVILPVTPACSEGRLG